MRNMLGKYWLLSALVVFLVGANVWLFNKSFLVEAKDKLPRINLSVLSAGSFVIRNPAFLEKSETSSFGETRNILVLGRSGGRHIAPDLTDTVAIIHLNGPLKKIKAISIPRDLAVKTAYGTVKINSLYLTGSKQSETKGLELIKNKAEEVTGLAVDSFILFDLDTVRKVIDDIGGLNVYVKNDINDTRFPTDEGPRYAGGFGRRLDEVGLWPDAVGEASGYETFRLERGLRYLDGETALKFVRTRNSARGDFDRMERQQEVLKAIKGKILSLNPVWDFPKLWSIFRTVQKNIRTDLSLGDIKAMWGLAKNLDLEKIETLGLNPESGLVAPEKMKFGSQTAYVLVAKSKPFDYDKIQSAVIDFINSE